MIELGIISAYGMLCQFCRATTPYRKKALVNGLQVRDEKKLPDVVPFRINSGVSDPDGLEWKVYQFYEDSAEGKDSDSQNGLCCTEQRKFEIK